VTAVKCLSVIFEGRGSKREREKHRKTFVVRTLNVSETLKNDKT
jgi:hypothetical protein